MSSSENDYSFKDYRRTVRPPLIKITSRIIHSVVHDDLESMKSLIRDYPHNIFEITDNEGYNIFHISIICESFEVFDFLLSLDDCPLEVPTSTKFKIYGQTPLQIALTCCMEIGQPSIKEHFACSLIEKGVAIDQIFPSLYNHSMLHCAIEKNYLKAAQLLIEKSADLNSEDYTGQTPLRVAVNKKNDEAVTMLLYFGANPSIPDLKGTLPFYLALLNRFDISLLENLLLCTFDNYSTDYAVPFYDLYCLLKSNSPLLTDGLKYVTSVKPDEGGKYPFSFYSLLINLKLDNLKLLVEKFDDILRDLTDPSLQGPLMYYTCIPTSIENFNLLLQNSFNLNVIEYVNQAEIIHYLIKYLTRDPVLLNLTSELIIFLLSYGANIYDEDLEHIYRIYGDCEFFRILLHMDILKSTRHNQYRKPDIMSVLIYDVHTNLETVLEDFNKYRFDSVKETSNYFSHWKLQKFCHDLPTVPLLVELARNEVRKFLIGKYRVENSRQLYTLLKALPIDPVHAKIISLETPIYCNNVTII